MREVAKSREFYLTLYRGEGIAGHPKKFRSIEIKKVSPIVGGGCWVETETGIDRVTESLVTIDNKSEGVDF